MSHCWTNSGNLYGIASYLIATLQPVKNTLYNSLCSWGASYPAIQTFLSSLI